MASCSATRLCTAAALTSQASSSTGLKLAAGRHSVRVAGASSSYSASRLIATHGQSRVTAWFKFGKRGLDAEASGIYGSQARDDFDRDDVEHYFNYMGMLAVEGTYDRLEALLNTGVHPVDILLMMAASEGDRPKIQELLKAGAKADVVDYEGRTALDRATDEEIRELIRNGVTSTSNA